MANNKVVMAMSGGVDSSTAAYLLKRDGYEVIGVTMRLFDHQKSTAPDCDSPFCRSPKHHQDAREVAAQLGIRHYVVNYQDDFQQRVITPFVETYLRGMTPSPCILCNSLFKFSKLHRFAKCLGIPKVATGHYANIQYDEITDRQLLMKGLDERKDQSYFLFDLDQHHLKDTIFPLGQLNKREIRQLAEELNLPVADKQESQEICFIPNGDYTAFIDQYQDHNLLARRGPGEIVLRDGTVVGRHEGIHHFTIGQRRGLGFSLGYPAYVIAIRHEQNQVVIGRKEDLLARRCLVGRCNWIAIPSLDETIEVTVKIRSRATASSATVRPTGENTAEVTFAEAQSAITPGQAAVFYWDNVVVGGGWIYRAVAEDI